MVEGISENKPAMNFMVDLNVETMLKLWNKKYIA